MANFEEIATTHAEKLTDKDYKSYFNDVNTKLSELGFEVLINEKAKAEFVPVGRLNEVVGQRDTFKTQVGDLNKQLETLKTAAAGNDKLQADIQALINNNTTLMGELEKTKIDTAIMLAAKDAHDPNDVLAFINREKVKLTSKGELVGVEEELARLHTEKPHLFISKTPGKGGMDHSGSAGGQESLGMNNMIRRAAGRTF